MVDKKNAIQVPMGLAEIATGSDIYSDGFVDCNLMLLKNIKTGSVLLSHARYVVTPASSPDGTTVYPRGFSQQQASTLESFLKGTKRGDVIGITVFRPHNPAAEPVGSQHDFGTTEFLKSKGIKMRRYALPRYVDTLSGERIATDGDLAGFNAYWNYNDNELIITQSSPELPINPHSPRVQTHSPNPDEHLQWVRDNNALLLRIKPFKNPAVFEEHAR